MASRSWLFPVRRGPALQQEIPRARAESVSQTDQCKILVLLANCEGVSQRRLAELSEIDPVRLIRILEWLEVVGWAERRSDPQDRKVHVLALTESAKPVVERAWKMSRDTSTEALTGVTSDELHLLMDLLERVRANLLAVEAEARAAVAPRLAP